MDGSAAAEPKVAITTLACSTCGAAFLKVVEVIVAIDAVLAAGLPRLLGAAGFLVVEREPGAAFDQPCGLGVAALRAVVITTF